ncbi:tetratricopeptide repeat-containing sensor histidine kinase [Zunongwangia sp. HRR-M8]|uniref:tetratricopeptide repeat-containing sensor histidine kinase n=1 Tax=Zunongwangia sp. HRR-M8 TaxID=3015170 RepID=UPI0022DDAFC1|nr:histidine kinase [Zunongwangia sp. HRR-M8]WBL21355.1 histidine kinase [Zunongwangia sp. HRR-M8]
MSFKKIFFWLFFGILFQLHAQDENINFRSFSNLPSGVPIKYYNHLKTAKNPLNRLFYLDTISQIFKISGSVDSLLVYGQKIQRESKLLDNSSLQNKFEQLGLYYEAIGKRDIGLLDEAIASFIKGMEISGEAEINAFLKLGLAETYFLKRDRDKTVLYLNQIKNPSQNLKLAFSIDALKIDVAILDKDFDEAQNLVLEVLQHKKINNFLALQLRVEIANAQITSLTGNQEQAIQMFQQTKQKALEFSLYDLYIKSVLAEGSLYIRMEDYQMAEFALSTAYANTINWNRLELQRDIINLLVVLYKARDNYKNAYSLMTQKESITRSIAKKQNQRLVRDIELKYETLKKEQEINKLQKEQLKKEAEIDHQRTTKNAFLIGFLVILIPIILLLIVYYQKLQTQSLLNKKQEDLNKKEVQALLQKQELDLTKTSIKAQNEERNRIARELHDSIGGNLAAIKLQMNNGNSSSKELTIIGQLDATYQQVREISHSLIPKEFEEQAFSSLIKSYLDKLRGTESLDIEFSAYPEARINKVPEKMQVTLFNICKELVTNAIKHSEASLVSIQIIMPEEEYSLSLLYDDDGVGFNTEGNFKGIGFRNITQRVQEYNGTIAIDSAKDRGTVISIEFPKIKFTEE